MKRSPLVVLALLLAAPALAQKTYPPSSQGGGGAPGGGGVADPGGDGIMARTAVDTSAARTFTSPAGTLTLTNADGVAGNPGLDVDTSIFPQYSTGAADPPAACTLGDIYIETDTAEAYLCVDEDPDTWTLAGGTSFAATDDTTLVGNGAVLQNKAIPDCDDAGGAHLNYDTTANAWSCGTSGDGTGGSLDPSTTLDIYDDFLGGLPTSAGNMGETGFTSFAYGTGTTNVAAGTAAANPGVMELNSHATNDNSGAGVTWGANSLLQSSVWTTKNWTLDSVVYLGAAMTITDIGTWFGLSSGASSLLTATNCIWIRRDTDLTDTAFVFQVGNATGAAGCQAAGDGANSKTVLSTITPADNTAYRFRIRHTMTGGPGGVEMIGMRVNNETEKTFCSSGCDDTLGTVPAVPLVPVVGAVTRNTNGIHTSEVDYMHLHIDGLTRY
jgi:hypothetical protein